eukprot:793804_1
MVTPDGIETTHFTYFIFCFISTLSVDIYLWYQLYSKTIKLELNYNENELLSPFFSQKDKQIMNTTNMKRGIFFNMLFIISTIIFSGISASMLYLSVAYTVLFLTKAGFILSCFDIQWGSQNEDNTLGVLTDRQKQEQYWTKLMLVYNQVPQRPNRFNVSVHQTDMQRLLQ